MSNKKTKPINFILAAAGAVLLLGVIGFLLFVSQKENIESTQQRELKLIADYKTNKIVNWRHSYFRAADEIIYDDKVRQFAESYRPGAGNQEKKLAGLNSYLKVFSEKYQFSGIQICKSDGMVILSKYGTDADPDDYIKQSCTGDTLISAPFLSDFHKDSTEDIHLTLVVPIYERIGEDQTPAYYLFGRIDPKAYLYPVLKSWPYESRTSECILAGDAGDSVVLLNNTRFLTDAALAVKLPKQDTSFVSVKAHLAGDRVVTGIDYRNAEVHGYLKRIPDTKWALIVKTDHSELMEPVYYSVINITSYAFLLLSVLFFGFTFFFRKEKKKMYQALYEKEHERNALLEQYDYILQNSGDVIFLVDEKGKISEANMKALREYGYTREEIIGQPAEIIRANGDGPHLNEVISALRKQEAMVFETKHKRKDGSAFPVEVSAKLLTIDGAEYFQSIARDITERKQNEEKIKRLNRLYSMLSASNKAIVRKSNSDELFTEIIRVAIHLGKFKGIWIGRKINEAHTETIKEVGFNNGCATLTEILLLKKMEKLQTGLTPGSVYYCNDITGSGFLTPEESEKMHVSSFAAMTLDGHQKNPVYVILISDKANFFGEDDRMLLDEMAEDLSFGLKFFDMEKSFRVSEARFKTVVEESPAGIFILDRSGRMTYSNKLVHEITGLNEDNLRHYSWVRVLQQENRSQIIRGWFGALHNNQTYSANGTLTRPDGTRVHWSAKTSPIFAGTEIIGHAGVIIDETEIIEGQIEINKLFCAVSQITSGIIVTDISGKIEYVNPAFEKMTGYSADEALGRKPEFLRSGLTDEAVYKELNEHLTAGEPWRGEVISRKKSGDIYYESTSVTPVKDVQGDIVNFLAVMDDVTLVRSFRKTIENQVRLLEDVLELLPVGVWIMDEKGKIIRGNTAAKKIWTDSKYVGMDQFDVFKARWYKTGEEIQPHEWAAARAIRNRETSINEEIEIDCFDGTKKIIFNSAVPIISENGELTGAIIVNEDITNIKKTEKELIEAKERAEESNRLKGNFLANMSHELRTPMIGVLGYSEIIYDGDFDEEVVEYARMIHKSGKRLLDTLNLILDLSRLEAGKLELKKEQVDLVKISSDVIQNFRAAAERNGLYIHFESEFEYLKMLSDERLLNSILDNLINNAVKYTMTGGVTVTIASDEGTETGKRMIKISVADTGIGIAKENHEMIFEEFRQVSEGTDRGYEGTGLGLSITKKFVEKLNGAITLESKPGCGSVFHVFLPADVIEEQKKEKTMSDFKLNENEADSSKKSILLVENDELNVTIIQKYLQEKYLVKHVWNADMAIKMGNEKKYDAILMDINLGKGKDGLTAAKEIRSGALNADTPVIAMTAYAMQQDRTTFLEGGCTHYMAKPFRQMELLRMLDDVFAGKTASEMMNLP